MGEWQDLERQRLIFGESNWSPGLRYIQTRRRQDTKHTLPGAWLTRHPVLIPYKCKKLQSAGTCEEWDEIAGDGGGIITDDSV